jgi:formate dehydrogenase major subunit
VSGRDGPSNHGRLCVKGRFGFDYVHHPQRLLRPLIRRGRRAEGRRQTSSTRRPLAAFREATWEEALDARRAGLRRIRDGTAAARLAGFGSAKGSNEEAYLFQKLVRVGFGTNNVDHCTRLCHASSVAALMEGLNSGAVSNQVADVQHADCFIIIGANPTVNHPGRGDVHEERHRARREADPDRPAPHRAGAPRHAFRCSSGRTRRGAAERDAAHHRRAEDLVDHDFVRDRTHGYDELVRTLRPYSPEAMQHLCGIPATRSAPPRGCTPRRARP